MLIKTNRFYVGHYDSNSFIYQEIQKVLHQAKLRLYSYFNLNEILIVLSWFWVVCDNITRNSKNTKKWQCMCYQCNHIIEDLVLSSLDMYGSHLQYFLLSCYILHTYKIMSDEKFSVISSLLSKFWTKFNW